MNAPHSSPPGRVGLVVAVVTTVVLGLGLLARKGGPPASLTPAPSPALANPGGAPPRPPVPGTPHPAQPADTPDATPTAPQGPSDADLLAALPEATPTATQVLTELQSMAFGTVPLDVARWRAHLDWLARSGPGGLAAVRSWLAQPEDVLLGDELAAASGQPTLRQALLAVLGGRAEAADPAARAVLAEILATAGDPREVTLTGRWLEKVAPGQYRGPLLAAARESLALMLHPDSEPREVAPVLGILRELGDASLLPDLQRAARRWPDYAAWAVAGLPEEAGVTTLAEWVTRHPAPGSSLPSAALTQLGELSLHSESAREALRAAVERGAIPDAAWSRVALALVGERLLPSNGLLALEDPGAAERVTGLVPEPRAGQQLLTEGPAPTIPPDHWRRQMEWIDALVNQTTDPTAREKLLWARSRLEARLADRP